MHQVAFFFENRSLEIYFKPVFVFEANGPDSKKKIKTLDVHIFFLDFTGRSLTKTVENLKKCFSYRKKTF